MKRTILRYGLLSGVVMIVLFVLEFLIFRNAPDYDVQEVFGWAAMIISLVFVFFGIKHIRDKENGGRLTFGQGMKAGILIVLIASLALAIYNFVYVTVINPGFIEDYYR